VPDPDEYTTLTSSEGAQINGLTPGASLPTIISEAGLYRMILRSDKPLAKPFQRWVAHDVLPTIRTTGAYVAPAAGLAMDPAKLGGIVKSVVNRALEDHTRAQAEQTARRDARLDRELAAMQREIDTMVVEHDLRTAAVEYQGVHELLVAHKVAQHGRARKGFDSTDAGQGRCQLRAASAAGR
jgi:prophage antirepressor-like protein